MSQPMSMAHFSVLYKRIRDNHSPFSCSRPNARRVKYIDPHIDMRTNTVFSITFRGFGFEDKNLHCQNECRELSETLFQRCLRWLDGEDVQ